MTTKQRKPKSTKAEMLQRVNDVYVLLVKGASRREIIQYASDTWDISERSADTLQQRARKYFDERLQIERDTELGQSIARYELLFQKAFKVQDYKTCIQAQSRIDKIKSHDYDYAFVVETLENLNEDTSLAEQLFKSAGVPIN